MSYSWTHRIVEHDRVIDEADKEAFKRIADLIDAVDTFALCNAWSDVTEDQLEELATNAGDVRQKVTPDDIFRLKRTAGKP